MAHADIDGFIQKAIHEFQAKVNVKLEEACERSLATGTMGVKVTYYPNLRADVEVTDEVPYGEIHMVHADE